MLPILYERIIVSSGGAVTETLIGDLTHCKSCDVKETRNGAYTLTLETTIEEPLHEFLVSQNVIRCKANPSDDLQRFIITSTERNIDGTIVVHASHIKMLLEGIYSEGNINIENAETTYTGTPTYIWNKLQTDYVTVGNPFNFSSDISTSKAFARGFNIAETLADIYYGGKGSMVDVYGGEFHWDNYGIEFNANRGSNTGFLVKYGSNISDSVQTETMDKCYSHIVPYGKVSRIVKNNLGEVTQTQKMNFFAPPVQISNSQSVYKRAYMLECSDFLENYSVGANGENYSTVRTAMQEYASSYASYAGLGNLDVGISVDIRAELDEMSSIGLCDTVTVILDNFGTQAKAKISEAVYDSLLERWNKLVIGTPKITVADLIINKRRFLGGK